MKNITCLENVVGEFINNEERIDSIIGNNSSVMDYLIKYWDYKNSNYVWVIKWFLINNSLFWNSQTDISKALYKIQNFNLAEYIEWEINIYDEDLLNSYYYFDNWTDVRKWDKDVIYILKRAQYEWYDELYSDILNNFLEFIKDNYFIINNEKYK